MKQNYLFKSLILSAFLFAGSSAMAQSTGNVTINPSKDNTLYEDANGAISNGSGTLMHSGRIRRTSDNLRRAVLEFDIAAAIPAGATIDSVVLTIHVNKVKNSTGRTHTLHTVSKEWGEGSSNNSSTGNGANSTSGDATWKHSSYSGTNWTSLGGDFNSTASASTTISGTGFYTFTSTAMKNDVQAWANNSSNNHGWMIRGDENTSESIKVLTSREGAQANRPSLKIWYTCSKASFTNPNACVDAAITFTSNSTNSVSHKWDFDNNGTIDDTGSVASHTFSTSGVKQVKLITYSAGGCKDSIVKSVLVFGTPTAAFTHDTACVGDYFTFTSTPVGSKYEWDFDNDGDFDTAVSTQSIGHSFIIDGPQTVVFRFTDNNGCKDETMQQLFVNPRPFANFTSDVVCGKSFTTYQNVSVSSSTSNTYKWDFDNDGVFDSIINNKNSVQYAHPSGGTKSTTIVIITDIGCVDTTTKTVTVDSIPLPMLAIDTVCKGLFSNITDNSVTPVNSSYKWDFDNDGVYDDFTSGNKTYIFPNNGKNPLKLVITAPNNCADSIIDTANVEQGIIVSFSADTVCDGLTTTFTDNSTVTSNLTYNWDFDNDGTVDDNTVGNNTHTFGGDGIYTVELFITDAGGCKDSATINVEVKPNPVVSFTADSVCLGTATSFTDNSTDAGFGPSYYWDFDNDGSNDNGFPGNITHTYATGGTMQAKLRIQTIFGCTDSTTISVLVKEKPVSEFTLDKTDPDVALTNTSTGVIDDFEWDFGDGNTDNTTESPTHTYQNTGTYEICLTVSNECGDSTTCESFSIIGAYVNNVALLDAFSLSPNPVSSLVTITSLKDYAYSVNITDLQGRVVYTQDNVSGNLSVDMNTYSKGIYFVNIETEIGLVTYKIVKPE